MCRYNWHTAGSLGWPSTLKYKYILRIKYAEAVEGILSNDTRKLLRFQKLPKFWLQFNERNYCVIYHSFRHIFVAYCCDVALQSLVFWAGVPVIWMLVTLLIITMYFCYRCCQRETEKSTPCIKWAIGILALLSWQVTRLLHRDISQYHTFSSVNRHILVIVD